MKRIFIDGSAGTTGLSIRQRLATFSDLELLTLPDEQRRDSSARREAMEAADVVFLCLPDAAAREAMSFLSDSRTLVLDTSTAHRTLPNWAYGFPELIGQREKLCGATRIANPGCHASGFLALVSPLVREGLLSPDACLSAFSLTGYTGGGKSMIAQYEQEDRDPLLDAPRQYGLSQTHKHLPEMMQYAGLSTAPCFCPVVGDFPRGMEVTVPLFAKDLRGTPDDVRALYRHIYRGPVVRYAEGCDETGFLSAASFAGRDDMEISVFGGGERLLLVARFDNLGKGASGAAIQNMNILLGFDETKGLYL